MVKVTRLFGFGSICCCWCCASEKRASTIKRKSPTEREMSTGREAKKIRRKDSQLGLFCNISHTISEINAGIVFIFGVSVECSAKRGWSVCAPPFFYIHSRGYRQSMCSPYISAANSFDVFRKKKHFFLHSLCLYISTRIDDSNLFSHLLSPLIHRKHISRRKYRFKTWATS